MKKAEASSPLRFSTNKVKTTHGKASLSAFLLAVMTVTVPASPIGLVLETAGAAAKPAGRIAVTRGAEIAGTTVSQKIIRESVLKAAGRAAAETAGQASKPVVVIDLKASPAALVKAATEKTGPITGVSGKSWWKEIAAGTIGTGAGAGIYKLSSDLGVAMKRLAEDSPWVFGIGAGLFSAVLSITMLLRCGSPRRNKD